MGLFGNSQERLVTVSPELASGGKMRYSIANLQGVGAREQQEDSFTVMNALNEKLCDEQGMFFAVCDGMGGMKSGKTASETAVSSFRRSFSEMDRTGNISDQLLDAVYAASEEVESILDGDGGSTAVAGIILHEKLWYASVGDSYFYLLRKGMLYRLNAEHDMRRDALLENIRGGSFSAETGLDEQEAGALTQFIGMTGLNEVDRFIRPMQLMKGDTLLACSDGVGRVLNAEEVRDALCCLDGNEACNMLEQRIMEHCLMNQDNYTAMIIKCF